MFSGFVGLEEEGLFRRSPNLTLLNQVTDAYDRGDKDVIKESYDALLMKPLFRSRCVTGYVQRPKPCRCVNQEILARPSGTHFPGEYVSSDTAMPHSG